MSEPAERRRFPRIRKQLKIRLTILHDADFSKAQEATKANLLRLEAQQVFLKDMSIEGIRLECPSSYALGTIVRVEIEPQDGVKRYISFLATVFRITPAQGLFDAVLKFEDINDSVRERILKLLEPHK